MLPFAMVERSKEQQSSMVNRNVSLDKLIEMASIDLGPEEIPLGCLGRDTP
jgi:hypothetical protein